jgi:hypothetical protein
MTRPEVAEIITAIMELIEQETGEAPSDGATQPLIEIEEMIEEAISRHS